MKGYDGGLADGYRTVWWGAPKFGPANVQNPIAYQCGYKDGIDKAQKDLMRGHSDHYDKR